MAVKKQKLIKTFWLIGVIIVGLSMIIYLIYPLFLF